MKLLKSHGVDGGAAAGTASLAGLFVVLGRAGCGPLLDRFWAPGVAAAIFALAAGACLTLATSHLTPLAVGMGAAAVGLAVGAEFDVLPFLAARCFGVDRVATSLALLSIYFYFGAAVGPWGFAFLADIRGGYGPSLLTAASFLACGSGLLLTLGISDSRKPPCELRTRKEDMPTRRLDPRRAAP